MTSRSEQPSSKPNLGRDRWPDVSDADWLRKLANDLFSEHHMQHDTYNRLMQIAERTAEPPPAQASNERAALRGLVAAWNALGVGEHPPKVIGRWLMEHMKPAIDQIRDVLQQPDEPAEGRIEPKMDDETVILRRMLGAAQARIMELERAPQPPAAWQPIATAPKKPRAILVHCPERRNTYAVCWDPHLGDWVFWGGFGRPLDEVPTLWMPMVRPPVTKRGSDE